jgi:hypothetical protein
MDPPRLQTETLLVESLVLQVLPVRQVCLFPVYPGLLASLPHFRPPSSPEAVSDYSGLDCVKALGSVERLRFPAQHVLSVLAGLPCQLTHLLSICIRSQS